MALAPRRIVDDAEHGKARRRDPNQQVVDFIPDGERVDRWVFEIAIVVVLLLVVLFFVGTRGKAPMIQTLLTR